MQGRTRDAKIIMVLITFCSLSSRCGHNCYLLKLLGDRTMWAMMGPMGQPSSFAHRSVLKFAPFKDSTDLN